MIGPCMDKMMKRANEDRKDSTRVEIELDDALVAHYQAHADRLGISLETMIQLVFMEEIRQMKLEQNND